MKRILTTISSLLAGASMLLHAQTAITVTIDAEAENHQISPLIYGININKRVGKHEKFLTAFRKGGNRWTGYNWENNVSSAGSDYNFSNDLYLVQGISDNDKPARAITSLLEDAAEDKQHTLITVPLAGYVSAIPSGQVSAFSIEDYSKVELRKEGELSLTPDNSDTVVYIDEFINYLKHYYGTANNGGPTAYSLDNEPALWNNKHKYIHPKKTTMTELLEKSIETAKVIKELDPNAEVLGTAAFGWKGLTSLSVWDSQSIAPSDWWAVKDQYQNRFYVAYLKKMKEAGEEVGQRLLDVLDFHWYPTEKVNGGLIVNLGGDNTGAASNLTSEEAVAKRLQATRSFWDKSYYAESIGRPAVIPSLRQAIDTIYPGTKISVSEYKFGAEWHISGGIAVADILGIFGREEVYLAHKWDGLEDYSEAAFKLFLDYDGNGGKFGNTYAQTTLTDYELASSYSSIDEEGNMHIIYINKQDAEIEASFDISNGYYKSAKVYGFGPESAEIEEHDGINDLSSSFNYTVPAYAVLHFVLESEPQAYIASAETSSENASVITAELSEAPKNVSKTGFYILANGEKIEASSVTASGSSLTITLSDDIPSDIATLTFVYEQGDMENSEGIPFKKAEIELQNLHKDASAYLMEANVTEDGKTINLIFNQSVSESILSAQIKVNGETVSASDISASQKQITIKLDETVYSDQNLSVEFENTINFSNGSSIDKLIITDFNSLASITPPELLSSNVVDFGVNLELIFNKLMAIEEMDNAGFKVFINGTETAYTPVIEGEKISLTLASKIEYGDKVELSYENGNVTSIYGGKLQLIDKKELENNMATPPDVLALPGKMQIEDFYYYLNYNYKETEESGAVGSVVLGGFSSGTELAYRVKSETEQTYYMEILSASSGTDAYGEIYIDDNKASDFFLPHNSGWTNWVETHYPITIPSGEHLIKIVFKKPSVNLDYIDFSTTKTVDNAELRKAEVGIMGDKIDVQFTRLINETITADMLEVKAGDITMPISSIKEGITKNRFTVNLNGAIGEEETVTITFKGNATTDSNGSVSQDTYTITNSSVIDKTTVGTKKYLEDSKISPVPFNGKSLSIKAPKTIDKVEIFNINGTLVYSQWVNDSEVELNIPTVLSAGVYSIKLSAGDDIKVIPVIAN